jgi:WD40 repeat protein
VGYKCEHFILFYHSANLKQTGQLKRTLTRFGEPVSACIWAPDGQSFVTGCLDKDRNLCQWNLNGELIYDWGRHHRIQDLAVSPNGNRLVAMDCENHLHVYNFVTRELEYELDLKSNLGSVVISQNSRYLLVNKTDGEARMLDLDTRETVRTFSNGDAKEKYIIRGTYGGANESFVITGSESKSICFESNVQLADLLDGHIYIWHKENGTLVMKLDAHSEKGCCNSVAWNPRDPCMFASVGDDKVVRM